MSSRFRTAVASDIVSIARAVWQNPYTRSELHSYLQREIRRLASRYGYRGWTEYLVEHYGPLGKIGFVDVVWTDGRRLIASFENDSSARPKSLQKLVALRGSVLFWIYYGRRPSLTAVLNENDPEALVHMVHLKGIKMVRSRDAQSPFLPDNSDRSV